MKKVKVTQLEKQVLESIANGMYAELGFSDIGPTEVQSETGIEMKKLRGVLGSLVKKELIDIDRREDEGYKNNINRWIIYLMSEVQGLVPHWVEDENLEPVQLIVG